METGKVFWLIYEAAAKHPRYISNRGGTRSGKTYSTLQFLHTLIPKADKAGDVSSVVSETMPHLKRGAIRDFEAILGRPLKNDEHWNATDCIYAYDNGAKLEFFSADTNAKVLGPARKRLFVNECNHIAYETFRQLAVRTTGIIFLDYNPAALFWANTQIEVRENCETLITTYKDNEFLTPEQITEIESNKNDANWWKVYGCGEIGTLEGVIFPNLELIDQMPTADGLREVFGMDFGFTNDPSAMSRNLIDTGRKIIYTDEIFYARGMLNSDMAAAMEQAGVPKHGSMIIADCAEPKTIAELASYGYNMQPSYKATRKAEQLQKLKGYKICVTKRSLNAIRELREYCWMRTKDGQWLNEPQPFNDHYADCFRYACFTYLTQFANAGQYSYGFGTISGR